MFKRLIAAGALVSLAMVSPLATAQEAAADAAPTAPRVYAPINYDVSADPENILLLDLSNGRRVAIRLMPDWAPAHVERVKTLTRQGFYDGVIFHRVIEGFMAQTGDPTGTGTGGPDYRFGPIENAPADDVYEEGVLAMARQGGNGSSMGSQFFIVYEESSIPSDAAGGYTVFGRITSGLDELVDQVVSAGVEGGATDGRPAAPALVTSVVVE